MRKFFVATLVTAAALAGLSERALAADAAPTLVKAPSPAPAAPSWSGLYAGVTFGWGWGDPTTVTATGNDVDSIGLLAGVSGGSEEQPVGPVNFRTKGPFGGIEAGWNWQAGRTVAGIEADFNASGMTGQGATTSTLIGPNNVGAPLTQQQLSASQNVLWFGTLRPRMGWLATDNLLLFGSGGFAYGRVYDTVNYGTNPAITLDQGHPAFGAICPANFGNCIYGQSHQIAAGWTAGVGAEYRVPGTNASLKVEYLFVDLGPTGATAVALSAPAGASPTSFAAAFSHTEFSTLRVGLNFKFW
jgi:outer membrane immunogenic protein